MLKSFFILFPLLASTVNAAWSERPREALIRLLSQGFHQGQRCQVEISPIAEHDFRITVAAGSEKLTFTYDSQYHHTEKLQTDWQSLELIIVQAASARYHEPRRFTLTFDSRKLDLMIQESGGFRGWGASRQLSCVLRDGAPSVDLVLASVVRKGDQKESYQAKVKVTQNLFDRIKSEKLLFACRTTKDPDAFLVINREGYLVAIHKKARTVTQTCNKTGCLSNDYEDLNGFVSGAENSYFDPAANTRLDYFIGSIRYYDKYWIEESWANKDLKLPRGKDLAYVTIYDPKVHESAPKTNNFFCFLQKDSRAVSPSELGIALE